jgi:S-formylglutathione hydrolase FrmB
VKRIPWAGLALLVVTMVLTVQAPTAQGWGRLPRLSGQLIDLTNNHGRDRRLWSNALQENRDLYVYLPPGYEPTKKYPLCLWLHGLAMDEQHAVDHLLPILDCAMACGQLPPMVIAFPDGTRNGRPNLLASHSFYINSKLGCYEDYLEQDVYDFLVQNYSIRPERNAHVLGGFSGGGLAAYYHGIKYKDRYGVVMGMCPPLNLRWIDCHDRYFSKFDPECWGWRESVRPGHEVIGRFFCVFTFRLGQLVFPLFGRGPEALAKLSEHNPIEMLERYNIQDRDLAMFIAYGGRDEFNIMAQVESFLYKARERGISIQVNYDARANHDWDSMKPMVPDMINWLAPYLAPYSPDVVSPVKHSSFLSPSRTSSSNFSVQDRQTSWDTSSFPKASPSISPHKTQR